MHKPSSFYLYFAKESVEWSGKKSAAATGGIHLSQSQLFHFKSKSFLDFFTVHRFSRSTNYGGPHNRSMQYDVVDVSLMMCRCPYVVVDVSLSTCRCPYAVVGVSLFKCCCWCVAVDMSLWICRCGCVVVAVSLLICRFLMWWLLVCRHIGMSLSMWQSISCDTERVMGVWWGNTLFLK